MATNGVIAGRYRLLQRVGVGGMAEVHRARDERSGRDVAVKLLADHLAADDLSIQRFLREGRLSARLRHPHVVAGLDVGCDRASVGPYIVTEFVDGDDARDILKRRGRLPAAEAVAITVQVCDALTYAHGRGIVHGDVSAANILVRRSDRTAKLADFGIARAATATPAASAGHGLGAPGYLAPEVAGGDAATFQSDLYSLGVVACRLLAGEDAWQRSEDPLAEVCGDLSPEIAGAVARAIEHEPSRRQSSVERFRSDLVAAERRPAAEKRSRGARGPAPAAELPARGEAEPTQEKIRRPMLVVARSISSSPRPDRIVRVA